MLAVAIQEDFLVERDITQQVSRVRGVRRRRHGIEPLAICIHKSIGSSWCDVALGAPPTPQVLHINMHVNTDMFTYLCVYVCM